VKRLISLLLLAALSVPSTVFADELTELPLGFNDINPQLSIVNYDHARLPLQSVVPPMGYPQLAPTGIVQVPTAVITMTPSQALSISTNVVWSSSNSITPIGTITALEWKVNGVVVSAPPTIFPKAGANTVELRVQNSSGIWSEPTSKTFTVYTLPTAVISMSPSANIDNATAITWASNGSTASSGLTVSAVQWQLDSNAVTSTPPNGVIATVGSHIMQLRVRDSIGSWSAWTSKSFSVVQMNRPPTAVISMTPDSATTTIKDSTSITWGFSGSTDLDGDAISVSEWTLDGTIVASPNGAIATGGSHTMSLRVKDARGLWSTQVSKTFGVVAPSQKSYTYGRLSSYGDNAFSIPNVSVDASHPMVMTFTDPGSYHFTGEMYIDSSLGSIKTSGMYGGKKYNYTFTNSFSGTASFSRVSPEYTDTSADLVVTYWGY
jgi:hypothetical protein